MRVTPPSEMAGVSFAHRRNRGLTGPFMDQSFIASHPSSERPTARVPVGRSERHEGVVVAGAVMRSQRSHLCFTARFLRFSLISNADLNRAKLPVTAVVVPAG